MSKRRDLSKPIEPTQLITFYSYKGGVGRTMALANAACQMAIKHGKNVICIDWDLEAPGLHHYFGYTEDDLAGKAGLLDYLLDFIWQVKHEGSAGHVPQLDTYLQPLKEKDEKKITAGSVKFMHCGRTDASYMARVQEFDWDRFYREEDGYRIIETLKQQLRDKADITLIDARAGQAEVGATPTIQIPDAVVILFTSNRQCVAGTEEMTRRLVRHPQRVEQGIPQPKVILVPARVFPKEENYERWLEKSATPMFNRLVEEGLVSKRHQPKGLMECYVPVDPKYAVDECLPVLEDRPIPSDLKQAYVSLAQALDNFSYGLPAWLPTLPETRSKPAAESTEELRKRLKHAAQRGDSKRVTWEQLILVKRAIDEGRLDEAEVLLEASGTIIEAMGDTELLGALSYARAMLRLEQSRDNEAWIQLEDALKYLRQAGVSEGEMLTLADMGALKVKSGAIGEAEELYQRALAKAEEVGTEEGIRLIRKGLEECEAKRKEQGRRRGRKGGKSVRPRK